jgi:polar amino acid transport system substrate-binding protein
MQKARKFVGLLLAVALVVAVAALTGCGQSTSSTPSTSTGSTSTAAEKPTLKLVKAGVLTVGSDTAFPPFESMNGATAEGFDVDLATAVAKELGLTVNYTSQKFDTLIPQLKAGGTFDVIMSGMTITPDRQKEITFSTPYIDSNQSIAVVKGKFPKLDGNNTAAINTAFTGKIIGVQSGTTGEAWSKENLKGAKQIVPFDDTLSAFSALNAGKVDAVVNDLPVSAYLVKTSYTGDELVAEIPTGEQYGIGIATTNADLKTAIDAALAKLKTSGEYKTIYMKWFGVAPAGQ